MDDDKTTPEKHATSMDAGHRRRLRDRFAKTPSSLEDYETLELLLTYAIPRKDCKPLAKKLLAQFGDMDNALDAAPEELLNLDGAGKNTAILFALLNEITARREAARLRSNNKGKISSPEDVAAFAQAKLGGRKDEAFLVVYLNSKNKILGFEIEQEGTVNQAVVYPRKIIEGALRLGASGLIIVHNHPSGETEPSSHDIHLTGEIAKAAEPMDITLLDHLVVGRKEFFSFKAEGLLR